MLAGYPPFYDESGGFGTYKKILKGAVEYPDWCVYHERFSFPGSMSNSRLLTADTHPSFVLCLQVHAERDRVNIEVVGAQPRQAVRQHAQGERRHCSISVFAAGETTQASPKRTCVVSRFSRWLLIRESPACAGCRRHHGSPVLRVRRLERRTEEVCNHHQPWRFHDSGVLSPVRLRPHCCRCLLVFFREIPVPMVPEIDGENDTSYFEEYDDDDEHQEMISAEDQDKFLGW